jgi:hypothetical protein
LASLASAAGAIYFAYRICLLLFLPWYAQVLILGYLATDHLQVFFGMAGMETQVATMLLLANAYYYLTSQWTKLGVATGASVICRPEFVLWAFLISIAVIVWNRRAFQTLWFWVFMTGVSLKLEV